MAIVDTQTGIIIGAKHDSLTYHHELGHIEYNKSSSGILFGYIINELFFTTVGLLVLNSILEHILFKICFSLCYLVICILKIYEEVWCWKYAYRNKK